MLTLSQAVPAQRGEDEEGTEHPGRCLHAGLWQWQSRLCRGQAVPAAFMGELPPGPGGGPGPLPRPKAQRVSDTHPLISSPALGKKKMCSQAALLAPMGLGFFS